MDITKENFHKEDLIIIDNVIIYKKDLLRAISWIDFLKEKDLHEEDRKALSNLIKIVNYITRND